jgi:hypothetical protein
VYNLQIIVSFLLIGPAPFLLTLFPWSRALVWASQLTALTIFGTGFAFVLVRLIQLCSAVEVVESKFKEL